MTVKGLKGLSLGLDEYAKKIQGEVAERTITAIATEARQRLLQDTPVITGRLYRSTILRKDSQNSQTLGQFAPYANVVNNRRGYWNGAIQVAQKWAPFYAKSIADEWQVMPRKYAGT